MSSLAFVDVNLMAADTPHIWMLYKLELVCYHIADLLSNILEAFPIYKSTNFHNEIALLKLGFPFGAKFPCGLMQNWTKPFYLWRPQLSVRIPNG